MNEKLNTQDLTDWLADKHGMSKKNAESFVKEFFSLIEESLQKGKYVKIKGLGTFRLIEVESRESININTGERFEIEGHTKISFTPDPALKEAINKPFSHFEAVPITNDANLEDICTDNGSNEDETENEEEYFPINAETDLNNVEEEQTEESSTTIEPFVEKEEVILQNEQTQEPTTQPTGNMPVMRYFIGIVVFIILLCIGVVISVYYPDLLGGDKTDSAAAMESPHVSTTKNPTEEYTQLVDSLLAVHDSILSQTGVNVSVTAQENAESETYQLDSASYIIIGTKTVHTIQPGETLTRISLRFYGTKALYPYLIKHNPDAIKNPDNVPVGTKIRIPQLVKKE